MEIRSSNTGAISNDRRCCTATAASGDAPRRGMARTSLLLPVTGNFAISKKRLRYGKIVGKQIAYPLLLFFRDQTRYNRRYLPRAWRGLLRAKAAREETSVGTRPAQTGSISEGARLGFCPPTCVAAFASGNVDPAAGSDSKTEAHADVAQTDANAPSKSYDSFQGGATQRGRRGSTRIFR